MKPPRSPTNEQCKNLFPTQEGSPTSVKDLPTPFGQKVEVPSQSTSAKDVDYDEKPTKLYCLIESKDWTNIPSRCIDHPSEAATFVYRRDTSTQQLRWRQLPLHAALVFRAKTKVIAALIKSYPNGVRMKDDQGMLPLHLAFKYNSSESVIDILLQSYPKSIDMKDNKGRIPIELHRERHLDVLSLRSYISRSQCATNMSAAIEHKFTYTEKIKKITESHKREIRDIRERFEYLEQCDIKCEEYLKKAFEKIQQKDSELLEAKQKHKETAKVLENTRNEVVQLKKQLEYLKEEKERQMINLTKKSKEKENEMHQRLSKQDQKFERARNKMTQDIDVLKIASVANKEIRQDKEKNLEDMIGANEILLMRVNNLEKELAMQRGQKVSLQEQVDKRGKREEHLMARVEELTELLLKRYTEKTRLVKKHKDEMNLLLKKNFELQRDTP